MTFLNRYQSREKFGNMLASDGPVTTFPEILDPAGTWSPVFDVWAQWLGYELKTEGDRQMAMSKDRVRFFLPTRYFQNDQRGQNGFCRGTMQRILQRAFDMTHGESACMMDRFPGGFHIECRPSQFARFIVYRCEANEGINGVKDLEPCLTIENPFTRVAKQMEINVTTVRRVAVLLGMEISEPKDLVDVSHRFSSS